MRMCSSSTIVLKEAMAMVDNIMSVESLVLECIGPLEVGLPRARTCRTQPSLDDMI